MTKWPQNLVLVRHGESEQNKERTSIDKGHAKDFSETMKDTRNADIRLTKRGIEQALLTGDYLKKNYKKFDVAFVSPFMRAEETASNILQAWKKDAPRIVIDERVREKEFGIFHAITANDIAKKYPDWHHLKQIEGKYYFRPPGGESYPDLAIRLRSFLDTIIRDCGGQNVLVVTHSAIMKAFHKLITRLSEAELLEMSEKNDFANCTIVAYKFNPKLGKAGRMAVDIFNKTAY